MAVIVRVVIVLVHGVDQIHAACFPSFQVLPEQDVMGGLEAHDHRQPFTFIHMVRKVVDDPVDGGQAGAPGHQDDFLP